MKEANEFFAGEVDVLTVQLVGSRSGGKMDNFRRLRSSKRNDLREYYPGCETRCEPAYLNSAF